MLKIDEINRANHIVLVLEDNASIDYLASANALYTYLLQLHKKVSLYCAEFDYGLKVDFLPWSDKLKSSYPSSADYEINIKSSRVLLDYFISNKIKLNTKMSTSLYAGLLDSTKGFVVGVDGMIFAMLEVLVKSGADIKSCNENLINYHSLASLRLKTILLSKMRIIKDGQLAVFDLEEEDLNKSGAKLNDAASVFKDALGLPTVKTAIIMYKNEEIIREEV